MPCWLSKELLPLAPWVLSWECAQLSNVHWATVHWATGQWATIPQGDCPVSVLPRSYPILIFHCDNFYIKSCTVEFSRNSTLLHKTTYNKPALDSIFNHTVHNHLCLNHDVCFNQNDTDMQFDHQCSQLPTNHLTIGEPIMCQQSWLRPLQYLHRCVIAVNCALVNPCEVFCVKLNLFNHRCQ